MGWKPTGLPKLVPIEPASEKLHERLGSPVFWEVSFTNGTDEFTVRILVLKGENEFTLLTLMYANGTETERIEDPTPYTYQYEAMASARTEANLYYGSPPGKG